LQPAADLAAARAAVAGDASAYYRTCLGRARALREWNLLIEDFELAGAAAAGSLHGIPFVAKGNIALAGRALDCGSRILAGYRSPFDATAIERLRAAGALVLGRANLDEFAMGSSTEHGCHGVAHNPWRFERSAGGSSGGSAAAVAAGIVPFALGSDTGGSVRQPAAFCGVVGLKPSYGRVSRYGLVAFASSLDQIGPLTQSVRDAAEIYLVLAGADPSDMSSSTHAVEDPLLSLERGPSGLRIGVPRALLREGLTLAVRDDFETTLERLRAAGAELVDIELPTAELGVAIYYVLASAEASSNLARYDGLLYGAPRAAASLAESIRRTRSEGFGAEVQRRILIGSFVLSSGYQEAYYLRAQRARQKLIEDHARAFTRCDVIATPTAPTTAFALGERLDDPLAMYLGDVFTVTANLTGMPAIAVPTGVDGEGLPCSLQLAAPRFAEATLLRAARAVEALVDFAPLRAAMQRGLPA
jgi:aspartyl-tRNA(Asn)/glutamyl-tRNA(Gln) amidotransferase subunit A